MARERIIRDPGGPPTVNRDAIRAAARKIWDEKRRDSHHTRRDDDGRFTTQDGRTGHRADQRHDAGSERFDNAPALKPNRG